MITNKPYYVYVIQSENGKYYIGVSEDVQKRLEQHNNGQSKWTKRYKDWKVIYSKTFETLGEARKWENHLKKQKSGNGLRKIISAHNPA